ncbi:MAG: hypothetical protein QOI17_552 [Gaiellales bacterium]|nr:hypothetical protein [Gaiellales bacterium]
MSDLKPIHDDVKRLGRVPAVDPLVASARRVWREAAGPQVAQNSLPVRRSGDALVVHCASSAWASELTLLERHVRARLGTLLGCQPPLLRFEVGDVDAPDQVPVAPPAPPPVPPSSQQLEQARELAAAIVDPDLRRSAERAIAASLARDS